MTVSDWQLVLSLLCVAAAVAFLVRRGIQFFRARGACGGGSCGGCAGRTLDSQNTLVSLSPLPHGDKLGPTDRESRTKRPTPR